MVELAPCSERAYTDAPEAVSRGAAPSHFRPLAQRNEHVAVAHQARLEAFLAVDPPRQQAGDGQRHVLFALALATDRAGVLAAMAGIDHHEDVAARRG